MSLRLQFRLAFSLKKGSKNVASFVRHLVPGCLDGFLGFCESGVPVLVFKVRNSRVKPATITRFTERYITHLTAGVCLCFDFHVGLELAHYVLRL